MTYSADHTQQEDKARAEGGLPPDTLFSDDTYLNGVLLGVGEEDGLLPVYPLPGVAKPAGSEIVVPPYSYGFIVVEGAFPACM